MSQTTPPTVDALPTAPNSSTPTGFAAIMDAFLAALIVFRTQVVALGANMYANCVDCYNNAVAAAASAASALGYSNNAAASAAAAAASSNAPLWVSGASVAQYSTVLSPLDSLRAYRRITATGSGTTDPKNDPTNYVYSVPSAMTLLATLTPTAAANVDFLSTFSSTYDNYLIIGDGLIPATDTSLTMRVANAGTVDAASNYGGAPTSSIGTTTATSAGISSTVLAAGKGCSFVMQIANANDAVGGKVIQARATSQASATPGWISADTTYFYFNAAAISGVRFYWGGGANFVAGGKIRVYGYQNS